jgi:hypothetical protein
LNGIFTELTDIKTTITDCCADIQIDFDGVFTTLEDIRSSLTACCEDISGIFTVLNNLQISTTVDIDLSGIFTVLNNLTFTCFFDLVVNATVLTDLSGVYTTLEDIKTTLTDCCADIQIDFNGVFTTLEDIRSSLTACCDDISGIFTVLNNLQISTTVDIDLSGIFTVLNNLTFTCFFDLVVNATVLTDLSGVYTTLEDIKTTLTDCCADIQIDFDGVFTTLEDIRSSLTACCEDISGIFTVLNNLQISTTVDIDLSGIFTELTDIKTTITDCCADIQIDFDGVFTTLEDIRSSLTACCDDISGIFTVLNNLQISTTVDIDLSGIFTELTDIKTTITDCCADIQIDFDGVFTTLEDIRSTLTACCTDIAGIFTVLNSLELSCTLICDLNGVFTELTDIKTTITDCCADIQIDFDGVFTTLNSLELSCTLICDLNGVFTELTDIKTTITDCCADIQIDFDGTFTVLEDIRVTLTECCEEILIAIQNSTACAQSGITQAAIDAGGGFLVITATGNYSLKEDITAAGGSPNNAIIEIAVSDCTLDLCGRTIYGANGNTTNGIVTVTGLHNITIKNGNVIGIDGNGIKIDPNVVDLNLDTITTMTCGCFGILLLGDIADVEDLPDAVSNGYITNCQVIQCGSTLDDTVAACVSKKTMHRRLPGPTRFTLGGNGGLGVFGCKSLSFENCHFNENTNNSSNMYAAIVNSCQNIEFINCQFNDNMGQLDGVGLYLLDSRNTVVKDCIFARNTANTVTAVGVLLSGSFNNVFTNCKSLAHRGNNASGYLSITGNNNSFINCIATDMVADEAGGEASGFTIVAENNTTLLECQVLRVSAPNNRAIGFQIVANQMVLENCIAQRIAGSDAFAYSSRDNGGNKFLNCIGSDVEATVATEPGSGFLFQDETNNMIINCKALTITSAAAAVGFFDGFSSSSISANSAYENCIAENISGSTTYGYRTLNSNITYLNSQALQISGSDQLYAFYAEQANIIFNKCIAKNISGVTEIAGFFLNNPATNCSVIDSMVEQVNNSSGDAYGIALFGAVTCTIKNNHVTDVTGTGASIGYFDTATNSSTSVFMNNFAFNNGTNYSVTYPGAVALPTVSADLSAGTFPAAGATGGNVYNIDVNP